MGNEKRPLVVDPGPTDYQLQIFDKISSKELQPSDLSSPESVQLLIYYHQTTLVQLRDVEKRLDKSRTENENFREDREKLRIEPAKSNQKGITTLFEIPISLLAGFALNMLYDASFKDGPGWMLLSFSLVLLTFVRSDLIAAIFTRTAKMFKKGNDNDEN